MPGKPRIGEPPVVSSTPFQHPQCHLVAWSSNDGRIRNQIDRRLVRSHWASFVIEYLAYNGSQTGNEHASDHAVVHAHLRLRVKAAYLSNRPAKLDTALENCNLKLQNRFEGLKLDEDAFSEDERRKLKNVVVASSLGQCLIICSSSLQRGQNRPAEGSRRQGPNQLGSRPTFHMPRLKTCGCVL